LVLSGGIGDVLTYGWVLAGPEAGCVSIFRERGDNRDDEF
jgi:hypothetical protein